MGKHSFIALICALLFGVSISTSAQTVTIAFTGKKYGSSQYMRLSKVVITNITRNWTETIYYPDTILQLSCGVGIDDFDTDDGFALSQNIPNPFAGQTDFVLRMVEADNAHIAVYDMNGKMITGLDQQLSKGIHSFRIMLTTPQAYILKVHTKKNSGTVKTLNTGNAGENRIYYLGETNYQITYQLEAGKGNSNKPFMLGDLMQYVGFTNYYGSECHSQTVTQAQTSSELFTLKFSCENQPPVVNLSPVTSITHNSAVCGGEVISEGTGSVIDRGVCWNTEGVPTINNYCTHDGTGGGSFTSHITGLNPGTHYYLRAYARNNVSIAYSSDGYNPAPSFYTLPYVVTDDIPDILPTSVTTSVTLHGQVQYSTSVNMISKGFCWSTSPNPTINDNQVSSSSAGSNISATVTGLTRGVTYYVRTYAQINGNPLVYGNEVSFVAVDYPVVTTNNISNIATTSATCGGNVTSGGGVSVTARGVHYSTSSDFGGSCFITTNGSGTGNFTSSLTNLTPNTTYYVKAYATNSAGTRFGVVKSFTTAPPSVPTVTTNTVSNVTNSSATCGGIVTNDGASPVNARGVCWNTTQNPTTNGNHTTDGSGTGSFTSTIAGLAGGTTYYVRAYATNSVGTQYGEQMSFTTSASIPTVTTNVVSNITDSTASCGGNVTYDGGATITARGVCWSVSHNPTVNDSHTIDSSGSGIFYSNIVGLIPYTTYFVRAYATNSIGTAYGEEFYFSQKNPLDGQPCLNTTTVTDYDGNVYNTVQIGSQCWTKENLRTTHYADGSTITHSTSPSNNTAHLYYPNDNNNSAYAFPFGYLYNWSAVMHGAESSNTIPSGVQGICPVGWHIPSDAEWTLLTDYVSSHGEYVCGNHNDIARAFASSTAWDSDPFMNNCSIGTGQDSNNSTGFSALPSGGNYNGNSNNFKQNTYFWSSTILDNVVVKSRFLMTTSALIYNSATLSRNDGASVRCVRDEITSATQLPTVTTTVVSNISDNFATSGGNVSAGDGTPIYIRGVCWSMSPNPTVFDSHSTDCGGSGNFVSHLTGLVPNTVYFVRAYATNSLGTAYGNELSFTTSNTTSGQDGRPCQDSPSVTDYDGNVYTTIQIGSQCWMKNNLRTTHYSDGTVIPETAYHCPDNYSFNTNMYGYLYNWNTAMHCSPAEINSGLQGICPSGWHLPKDSEWEQLTDYVKTKSYFYCDYDSNNIAKALASNMGWNTSTGQICFPGVEPISNNVTGFSALPAGEKTTNMIGFGQLAKFWTSTVSSSNFNYAWSISLRFNLPDVHHSSSTEKSSCLSIRCVRNEKPTVSTSSVSVINSTSAICGGNVTSDGAEPVSARGICWSISPNPTTGDMHTTDSCGIGQFHSILAELTPNTLYYVRAYATNGLGTSYGEQNSFTTPVSDACLNTPTVTDYDGNTYNTVQIGNQCWMKENLKTTHYADGTEIPLSTTINPYGDTISPLRYYPNNSSSILTRYGYWYNWEAVMKNTSSSNNNPSGRQGICPVGWHVPSKAEWEQLINYVSSQFLYLCNNNNNYIAKSLSDTTWWHVSNNACAVGNNLNDNNSTGFSAVPAGCGGLGDCIGAATTFATSTRHFTSYYPLIVDDPYYFYISYERAYVEINYFRNAYSVRCLRAESDGATTPSVMSDTVSNITDTTAMCGGDVVTDGNVPVIARGVCWSTSQNPKISDSHTTDGTGTGNFTSNITGLIPGTTYYVRAYATNSLGTAYGEPRNFITNSSPCAATVSDHEGNVYNTVQIGNQCWTKENLRTTTSPSTGTYLIPTAGTGSTYTGKQARWYNNDSTTYAPMNYGLLYNWNAAVDTFNTAYGETSVSSYSNAVSVTFNGHRRGICPAGWHLPSDAEWTTMTDYVSSQSQYVCGGNTNYIAKALADSVGWNSHSGTCCVGNDQSANNATGFSAVPAGYCTSSLGMDAGGYALFWSATQRSSSYAYTRSLYYNFPDVSKQEKTKTYGYSVRCLRDELSAATLPTVTTNTISSIAATSATCGGNVTATGGASVTARGVCWSTSQNPTVSYSHTTDGSGTGSFTSSITGLTANTTYYVRAYATNSAGTSYGGQFTFTTAAPTVPTVATNNVSGITATSATCGGNITSDGGANVIARGVCWSTAQNPTVSGNHTTDGSDTGSFTSNIMELTANITYYVRAYATNSAGTGYGEQRSFTTFACGSSTVTDYDGNSYNTVQIGSQCWMKENLRTTHYSDGTSIPAGSSWSQTNPYYYDYSSSGIALAQRGYLYNWLAVMHGASSSTTNPSGVQGICPTGWHVPSDAEWTQLTDYVSSQSGYVCGTNNTYIAKALASSTGWNTSTTTCAVGNNQSANNATGFSAVPAGLDYGSFGYAGDRAGFWSATQSSNYSGTAYYHYLNYGSRIVSRDNYNKYGGFSVRCLRD